MRKLLLILFLASSLQSEASAAAFVVTWGADTASANVVKLVRIGQAYAAAEPDAYIMTWNATRQVYETTSLDDATFLNDYYQIYDGSGSIVIDTLCVNSNLIDADQIEDKFVRNDGDDLKRGNLYIRPAPGATNTELRIDNSGSIITLQATDTTAGTSNNILRAIAASFDLENAAGSDIPLTGVAPSAIANSAVTRAMSDSNRGPGWTWNSGANTLMGLRSDVNSLLGTGTFAANDTLFLTGAGAGGGIRLNWSFDPAGVNDSIAFVQVYYGSAAIAGYSQSGAAGLSSPTLSAIRGAMNAIYPPRGALSATIPVLENYYIIVVAFDHTSPTPQAWGSNQILVTGVPTAIDPSTPIVGTATSYGGAITTLANRIAAIGGTINSKVLWTQTDVAATGGANPTKGEWWNDDNTLNDRIFFTFYKDPSYTHLRLRGISHHSGASKQGFFSLGTGAGAGDVTVTHSATPHTEQEWQLTVDVSSLSPSVQSATFNLLDLATGTGDTCYVHSLILEAFIPDN